MIFYFLKYLYIFQILLLILLKINYYKKIWEKKLYNEQKILFKNIENEIINWNYFFWIISIIDDNIIDFDNINIYKVSLEKIFINKNKKKLEEIKLIYKTNFYALLLKIYKNILWKKNNFLEVEKEKIFTKKFINNNLNLIYIILFEKMSFLINLDLELIYIFEFRKNLLLNADKISDSKTKKQLKKAIKYYFTKLEKPKLKKIWK